MNGTSFSQGSDLNLLRRHSQNDTITEPPAKMTFSNPVSISNSAIRLTPCVLTFYLTHHEMPSHCAYRHLKAISLETEHGSLADYHQVEKINTYIGKANLSNGEHCGKGIVFDAEHFPPLRGQHCKLSALALIDAYCSDILTQKKIPLLSERQKCPKNKPILSVRKIAKKHNSIQGEVLQVCDLEKIAMDMGYKVEILTVENEIDFVTKISERIGKQFLITFYSLNIHKPSGIELSESPHQHTEHASVISKYFAGYHTVTLNHWGESSTGIPISDLFISTSNLAAYRSPENYWINNKTKISLADEPRIRHSGEKDYKYRLHCDSAMKIIYITGNNKEEFEKRYIKSIVPSAGSGFRKILFAIEPDMSHPRWKQHNQ